METYKEILRGKHFVLKCDSVTALLDLRCLGTMKNEFRDKIVKEIWTLLYSINAQVTLSYINTSKNVIADENSRIFHSPTTEWQLDQGTFEFIRQRVPLMNFDLFSSHLNKKFKRFASWFPMPGCEVVNCFSFDWYTVIGYAYPPHSLLLKSLAFVKISRISSVYFIIPYFEKSVWFPLMQELLVEPPLMLPRKTAKLLTLPFKSDIKSHPLRNSMRMAFVHLSGTL